MTSEAGMQDLWATGLSNLPPKQLLSSLRQNLSSHSTLISSLSEYLTQRAAIEQEYVKSLNKLIGKIGGVEGMGGAERGSLGGVGLVWERVVGEGVDTAQSHSQLASTLITSFSDPLRSLPQKLTPWTRISNSDSNLERTLKAHESSLKTLEKAEKKGKSTPKAIAAQSEVNSTLQSLEIELPGLCSEYQAVQAGQGKWLKEMLIRFETLNADMGNGMGRRAEGGMEKALGWEVGDDLRRTVGRLGGSVGGGGGGGGMGTPGRSPSVRRPTVDSQFRPSTASSQAPLPNRTNSNLGPSDFGSGGGFDRGTNGGGGGGNMSSSVSSSGGSILPSSGSSSLTSTLKSKFSRKSSMIVPSGSSRFESLNNRNGNSNNDGTDGGGGAGGRDRSGSNASTLRNGASGGRVTMGSVGGRNGGSGGMGGGEEVLSGGGANGGSGQVDSEGFSVRPPDAEQAPWERPSNTPRDLLDEDDDNNGESDSIAPLASPLSISGQQPKLNLSLAPLPIQESESERQAVLDKMQSTLLTRPPSSANPNRRSTIARGRRDVRNTTFNTLPDDMPLAQAMRERGISADNGPIPATPEKQISTDAPSARGGAGGAFSDSPIASSPIGSMTNFASSPPPVQRQDSAMSSISGGGSSNPFASTPAQTLGSGLRASITESVNIVTRGGLVQKAMITGEVTLSLREMMGKNTSRPVHIKLDEFEQLEKVAPNPKYLSQYPERPGEYYLNLEALAAATATSMTSQPVLFKYQLHIPEGKAGEYAPIEMNPQWKSLDGETRLVLNYKANTEGQLGKQLLASSFASHSNGIDSSHRRISDLSFIAGLGGPSVTTVQAKPPGGTWSPERRKMLWKVDDLEFDASSVGSAGKIVARFVTEGEEQGVPEGVVVRWRCEGTLTSGLGIVVVQDESAEGWKFEEVKKAVVSGKYMAE